MFTVIYGSKTFIINSARARKIILEAAEAKEVGNLAEAQELMRLAVKAEGQAMAEGQA